MVPEETPRDAALDVPTHQYYPFVTDTMLAHMSIPERASTIRELMHYMGSSHSAFTISENIPDVLADRAKWSTVAQELIQSPFKKPSEMVRAVHTPAFEWLHSHGYNSRSNYVRTVARSDFLYVPSTCPSCNTESEPVVSGPKASNHVVSLDSPD